LIHIQVVRPLGFLFFPAPNRSLLALRLNTRINKATEKLFGFALANAREMLTGRFREFVRYDIFFILNGIPMDLLGWIAIAILVIVFVIGVIAMWTQPPDDNTCECQPARFCSRCGKKLSHPRPDTSM
jgi:hypothetical protein